jgi:ElaA protein
MTASKIIYKIIPFKLLSPYILYDILALREAVFTIEQKCPLADLDYLDKNAIHAIGQYDGLVCAVARILPPNIYKANVASFGRFLVKKDFRKKGVGIKLMQEVMHYIYTHYPNAPIDISAQLYLKKFYTDLGLKAIGEPYDEGGILHIRMVANLK